MLSCDASAGYPFRVAGTRMCALLGADLKGRSLLSLFREADRGEVQDILGIVAHETQATVAGATVEGTLNGNAFRNPAKFSGAAVGTAFNATIVFQAVNLRADIVGTRSDGESYAVTVKFAGGGPNNCEGSGPVKKG